MSQTKVTKPLLLKNGKTAGKSTITVGKVPCTHPWAERSMPLHGHPGNIMPKTGTLLRESAHGVALVVGGGGVLPLVSPGRSWPRRYPAPTTMCNSPSEPTSWTTRLEPQSPGPHLLLESRGSPHSRPIPGPLCCSLLSVSCLPLQTSPGSWAPSPVPQDLFSKSDPFMEIYKTNGEQSDQLVWRTEVGAWGNGEGGRKSRVGNLDRR